jgi:hypothetical protein
MSTLHGRSRIGPDGTLRITLPPDCANSEIEYVLEVHTAGTNGRPVATALRKRSGQARRDSLRRLAGSIDDPTFQRPPQGTAEPLEPLD